MGNAGCAAKLGVECVPLRLVVAVGHWDKSLSRVRAKQDGIQTSEN